MQWQRFSNYWPCGRYSSWAADLNSKACLLPCPLPCPFYPLLIPHSVMSQWRWWHCLSSPNPLLPVRFPKPGLKSGATNMLSASCPASSSLTNHILLLCEPHKYSYRLMDFAYLCFQIKNTSRNEKIKQNQMLLEIKHSWWINQDGVGVLSLL